MELESRERHLLALFRDRGNLDTNLTEDPKVRGLGTSAAFISRLVVKALSLVRCRAIVVPMKIRYTDERSGGLFVSSR